MKFSEKYQAHMALHGKAVPSFEIKQLYDRESTSYSNVQQPFIQAYRPTICAASASPMPLYGGKGGGTTVIRSTCKGKYYYTQDTWETEERAKIVIPALANKSWQARLAWYYKGNQMIAGEAPRITEITTKLGFGGVIRLDNFLTGWDSDRMKYSNAPPAYAICQMISLILSFDNEVMVINHAFQWQSGVAPLEGKLVGLKYHYDHSIKSITDARDILLAGPPFYWETKQCCLYDLGLEKTASPSATEIESAYQKLYSAYTSDYNTKKAAIEALIVEYNSNWLDC